MQAARRGVHCHAGLKAAGGAHLVPWHDSDGEGAGATAQNCVRAIVEQLKGWIEATTTDPDEGGGEQLGWQLAGQLGARIVMFNIFIEYKIDMIHKIVGDYVAWAHPPPPTGGCLLWRYNSSTFINQSVAY